MFQYNLNKTNHHVLLLAHGIMGLTTYVRKANLRNIRYTLPVAYESLSANVNLLSTNYLAAIV